MSLHQAASMSNLHPEAPEKSSDFGPLSACGHPPGRTAPADDRRHESSHDGQWQLVWQLAWLRALRLCACTLPQHLPADALIEFVLRRRLRLGFVLAQGGGLHLPERGRTGAHQASWLSSSQKRGCCRGLPGDVTCCAWPAARTCASLALAVLR